MLLLKFKKYPIIQYFYRDYIIYPTYINLSYMWSFGVLSGLCLVLQLITGIFLAMHYVPNADLAFLSVEYIMREVQYGWLLRYMHANGASFFFLCVYFHMFRNFYYRSYMAPRRLLWAIGVVILIIMILTAFMGYVLPWGQMSFWAATVITSLFSALPVVGVSIVQWLWGGYAVDNATLNRFFSLHYLLPFILILFVIIHLLLLHEVGSTNPLGIHLKEDKIPFHPYYTFKDLLGIIIFLIFFVACVCFTPDYLGHSDNYIPANPLVTPTHIVPEWYFLPFYAILRSIPNKLGGVCVLALALIILALFPFMLNVRGTAWLFRSPRTYKFLFWCFMCICLGLGWIGQMPVEYPFLEVGQVASLLYFVYFLLFFLPFSIMQQAYIVIQAYYSKIWGYHVLFSLLFIWGLSVGSLVLATITKGLLWGLGNITVSISIVIIGFISMTLILLIFSLIYYFVINPYSYQLIKSISLPIGIPFLQCVYFHFGRVERLLFEFRKEQSN